MSERLDRVETRMDSIEASGCTRVVNRMPPATSRPPPIVMTGSGGLYLSQQKDQTWRHSLLRMVRANDRGQESPHAVADCLAKLNKKVHGGISDKSVGPNCIVACGIGTEAESTNPIPARHETTAYQSSRQS